MPRPYRNDASLNLNLNRIRAYIRDNPGRWEGDSLHPKTARW